jgi:hypothetical protein
MKRLFFLLIFAVEISLACRAQVEPEVLVFSVGNISFAMVPVEGGTL